MGAEMRKRLPERILSEADVAIRPNADGMATSLLRALLISSGDAILITDLEHRSLACNGIFAEFFRVPADEAVSMGVEELRAYVYPRLRDPQAWRDGLDQMYAAPMEAHEDELELVGDRPLWLRRTTGPVVGDDGRVEGRYWRFRDITADRRREQMRQLVFEMSTLLDPEPAQICRRITEALSEFYGATAILSIREGRRMLFREIHGVPHWLAHIKENQVRDSYCQFALRTLRPLLIQDARESARYGALMPVSIGFTRYLGAPIVDRRGRPIGSLCFMDGASDLPLGEDDLQLISMLAARISTELDRERLYLERTADQRADLERQRRDLAETQAVLTAMNGAFEMLSSPVDAAGLLAGQTKLLQGVLGYRSVALLQGDGTRFEGWRIGARGRYPKSTVLDLSAEPDLLSMLLTAIPGTVELRFETHPTGALGELLGTRHAAVAAIAGPSHSPALLALGSDLPPDTDERRHRLHLVALMDQVALLLTAHSLQHRLVETNDQLRATHHRLVQSEKLSVVGTLAASTAHDIRNIVAALSLECSMGEAEPEAALQNVRAQLDRFAVLAHRLLSYARPKLLAREKVGVNELLLRVVALTDAQVRVSGASLRLQLDPIEPHVIADSSQFEHLFINLLFNALQAMQPVGGSLRIGTRVVGGDVIVEVEDNGPGLPAEIAENLFEPFRSSRSDGFGLGLFSCRRIAVEHGWEMAVLSEGRGTTFRVTMRRCEESEDA